MALALCMAFNNAAASAESTARHLHRRPGCHWPLTCRNRVAKRNGLSTRLGKAIIVLTGNWMGKNFDEIELFPFWRTIADLGAVIYVHGNPSTVR